MINRNIPYKNIIMEHNRKNQNVRVNLPKEFKLKKYQIGDENYWAKLETDIGDFDTIESALKYFKNNYMIELEKIKNNCFFIINEEKTPIASCILWYNMSKNKPIFTIDWLVVDEKYQGNGLGKVILSETLKLANTLNKNTPIFLHTQPWSYKAINLYNKFGFSILKSKTFSNYVNEYNDAVKILKDLYSYETYYNIVKNTI